MVVVGHGDGQGVRHRAQANAGKQGGTHGVPEAEARVGLDGAGEGGAQVLHGGLNAAVVFHIGGNEHADDGEGGQQHDDALNDGHLGHGLDAAGERVDDGNDDDQHDAQIIGVGAGDSSEHLGAGGDLAGCEEGQAEGTGNGQSGHHGLGLEPQAQQLLERNGAGAVPEDGHLAAHAAKAVGSGEKACVIDQGGGEAHLIAQARGCDHGAAGHGVGGGDHGDGKGAQSAAAGEEGGQAVLTALPGLILDIEAEAHDDHRVNGEDHQHRPGRGRGDRKSSQIVAHALFPPLFLSDRFFLKRAVRGNSSHLAR